MSPDQEVAALGWIVLAGALAALLLAPTLLEWAGELIFAGRLP